MEFDDRLYRTFFVLESLDKQYNILKTDERTQVVEKKDSKVFITKELVGNDKLEIKLLWETIKEIKTEAITDVGDVISLSQAAKEVNRSIVWVYNDDSSYIFVFTTKSTLIKEVQEILSKYFGIRTDNVYFTNKFFNHLIDSDIVQEVQSASFQTNRENLSTITLSGGNIELSDVYDDINNQENSITEMSVILRNNNRIRIYKNSKIKIYGNPSLYDIFDTIIKIRRLLVQERYFFE